MVQFEVCWPVGSVPTGRAPQCLTGSPFKYLKHILYQNQYYKVLHINVRSCAPSGRTRTFLHILYGGTGKLMTGHHNRWPPSCTKISFFDSSMALKIIVCTGLIVLVTLTWMQQTALKICIHWSILKNLFLKMSLLAVFLHSNFICDRSTDIFLTANEGNLLHSM